MWARRGTKPEDESLFDPTVTAGAVPDAPDFEERRRKHRRLKTRSTRIMAVLGVVAVVSVLAGVVLALLDVPGPVTGIVWAVGLVAAIGAVFSYYDDGSGSGGDDPPPSFAGNLYGS